MSAPEFIDGHGDILIVVDHASAHVPADIALNIDPALLDLHIAIDIGAAALARALAERLDARALLAGVSRLVIDLNREPDHPRLVPLESDGHAIPGNVGIDVAARIRRFHAPWHDAIASAISARRPALIVAVHSFTPVLRTDPAARPWEVGLLYNTDDRAARAALAALAARDVVAGDNAPYSGKLLNATMNRHAEANGIPYLGFEVRQDLIDTADGVRRWARLLDGVVYDVRNGLAQRGSVAT